MRDELTRYAYEVLDLSETQIVCLLYAPFVQQGQGLKHYLEREQPDYLPYLGKMHELLTLAPEQPLTGEQQLLALHLKACSHLSLAQLRTLYQAQRSENDLQGQRTPIEIILAKDPQRRISKRPTARRVRLSLNPFLGDRGWISSEERRKATMPTFIQLGATRDGLDPYLVVCYTSIDR